MSCHRRPEDMGGNTNHGRPVEIQGVRKTRGGVSYDLRSPDRMKSNNTAANPKNGRHTLVFHRTERRDFDHDSEINSEYEGDPINSSQRRDSFYTQGDVEDQALSEDLSMPRLERRPSRLEENDSHIDDVYTSTNPHPLLDEGRHDNAGRPRTLMSRTFGAGSTQPGRGEYFEKHPRVDSRFSDITLKFKKILHG